MGGYKKESLEKLLILIDEICSMDDNLWFKELLSEKFKNEELNFPNSSEIFKNTETIKKYLKISPELSIDYSFISHKLLRTRLELDNLRMENVRIDLIEENELVRFYNYIIYAFYQVEDLINFYFYTKYPNIESLLDHLEMIEDDFFNFSRSGKEMNVSDISIWHKLTAFNLEYFRGNDRFIGMNIDNLRKVRNESVHRCSVILRNKEQGSRHIYKFLKNSTYNSIHSDLKRLVQKISENLN